MAKQPFWPLNHSLLEVRLDMINATIIIIIDKSILQRLWLWNNVIGQTCGTFSTLTYYGYFWVLFGIISYLVIVMLNFCRLSAFFMKTVLHSSVTMYVVKNIDNWKLPESIYLNIVLIPVARKYFGILYQLIYLRGPTKFCHYLTLNGLSLTWNIVLVVLKHFEM